MWPLVGAEYGFPRWTGRWRTRRSRKDGPSRQGVIIGIREISRSQQAGAVEFVGNWLVTGACRQSLTNPWWTTAPVTRPTSRRDAMRSVNCHR
jgi:hypothetical protein